MTRKAIHGLSRTSVGCDISDEAVQFGKAIQSWKRRTLKVWPSPAEILEIAKSIGYQKQVVINNKEITNSLQVDK